MIAERNPEIRKAVNTLYELSSDEQVRLEYERRQKAWRDRLSQNEGYYQEGRQEIIDLLKSGKTPEEIIRDYGN